VVRLLRCRSSLLVCDVTCSFVSCYALRGSFCSRAEELRNELSVSYCIGTKMISGRALHFVFKIADRTLTAKFYREVLGMKVNV
jgi:hypothetical protein